MSFAVQEIGLESKTSIVRHYPGNGGSLLVLIAGFGYTLEMPIFYYLERHFRETGTPLLMVDFGYSKDKPFLGIQDNQKEKQFSKDIESLARFLSTDGAEDLFLCGKSLGSTVCLSLLDDSDIYSRVRKVAWLTPGTAASKIYESIPHNKLENLVVYGSNDSYTTADMISGLSGFSNLQLLAVQNGDHSLDTDGAGDSISELKTVVTSVIRFLEDA